MEEENTIYQQVQNICKENVHCKKFGELGSKCPLHPQKIAWYTYKCICVHSKTDGELI